MAQLWFSFWANEYLSDGKIRVLSYEKRGILQTLWAFAWSDGSIPSDPEELGMMLGIPAKAMRTHCDWIARFFESHPGLPGRLVSPRLELERERIEKKGAKASESARVRWERSRNANASETHQEGICERNANASETDMRIGCVGHATQTQSKETTKPLPLSGQGRAKASKGEDLGNYPDELRESLSRWRALLSWMKTPEIADQFPAEKRYVAAGAGTTEATWKAWEKRMQARVQGHAVTHGDMAQAIGSWEQAKRRKAEQGVQLSAPMLPTLINSDDFVDALVLAVRKRMESAEVESAS